MKRYHVTIAPSSKSYFIKAKSKRDAIKKARARFRKNPGRTDAYCDEALSTGP